MIVKNSSPSREDRRLKHILGMLKPQLDFQGAQARELELEYLRLIYAVSQIRKQGENAQGYFVITRRGMLNRLKQLEQKYQGNEYAELLMISSSVYLGPTAQPDKTEILSGIVRAAVLERVDGRPAATIHRNMREFILTETILGQERDVRQVKDEKRFPFGVRGGDYGVGEKHT